MKKFITERAFYATVLAITVPVALQNLIVFGVSMTDTIMLGRMGDIQLSASAQANQPGFVFQLLVFGLAGGGSVLASQYYGKGNMEAVRRVIGIVLRIAIISSLILSVSVFIFPEQIMSFYIKTDTAEGQLILSEAVKFLKIIAFSYFFFGITVAFATIIRSVEIVKVSVVVSAMSFVINVIFNWIFIFGNLGAPALGIRGSAFGTLIARIFEFCALLIYAGFIDKKLKFSLKYIFKRDKRLSADFVKYSLPVVANELAWSCGITLQAAILGKLSNEILAANSIAMVLQQLATIIIFGVASAATVIVGKKIGENNLEGARNAGSTFMVWSIILGAVGSLTILLLRKPFVSIYNIEPQTRALAENLLIITSVIVFFISIAATSIVGVLRGAGDTKFALKLELVTLWCVAVPLGSIFGFIFKAPILLTYAFLKIDEPIKSLIAYIRTSKESTYRSVTRD